MRRAQKKKKLHKNFAKEISIKCNFDLFSESVDFLIIDRPESAGAKGDVSQIRGCVHPLHPF